MINKKLLSFDRGALRFVGANVAFQWLGHVLLVIDISGPANYLTGRFLSAPSKHAK